MGRILNRLRWLAANLACFSMVFFPLAQGQAAARTQAEKAREFIKLLGLTPNHKVTVGEFHSRFRQWYPQPFRIQMDRWAALHKNELMPTITASTVKDAGGFDQVRMLVSKDGEDATLTTGSDFMMVGGVKMKPMDYWDLTGWLKGAVKNDKQFKKVVEKSKPMSLEKVSIALSRAEFNRLTPEQRAEYFVRLREVQEDLSKILPSNDRKTVQIETAPQDVVARWVMGLPAFAAPAGPDVKAGDSCIVAGYVSQYGENKSCGGMSTGRRDFLDQIRTQFSTTFKRAQACAPQSFPCNPLVYGFTESGGAHCVAAGDMRYATSKCNEAAPINTIDERRKIVQSWVKAQGKDDVLGFNEKGEVKEDQFSLIEKQLKEMNELVAKGDAICAAEGEKLKKIENQKSACENLHIRGFSLRTFGPAPEPPRPPAIIDECPQKVLGSHLEEGKGCVCDPGLAAADAGDGKKKCAEPPPKPDNIAKADDDGELPLPPLPEKPAKKEQECGFFCRNTWVVPLLVGVGVLGLMYFLFRSNNTTAQTPVYVPPVSPPGTTIPVVTPPPPAPPPPPSSKPTTGEGGTVVAPINSGGVR